jgi:hypothetical protein
MVAVRVDPPQVKLQTEFAVFGPLDTAGIQASVVDQVTCGGVVVPLNVAVKVTPVYVPSA